MKLTKDTARKDCIFFCYIGNCLPLPLGEVAERRPSQSPAVTALALSVTCGDSSPRGRAKEGEPRRESQGGLASPFGRGGRAKRGRRGRGRRGRGRRGRSVNGTLFYLPSDRTIVASVSSRDGQMSYPLLYSKYTKEIPVDPIICTN